MPALVTELRMLLALSAGSAAVAAVLARAQRGEFSDDPAPLEAALAALQPALATAAARSACARIRDRNRLGRYS